MITYISSWAHQVIVSVIIAIILEMILSPNSKTTKYVKTVIGVYVMYAIIAPGLNLISGEEMDFSELNYEEYFTSSEIYEDLSENINVIESNQFEESYKLNLKQDIENKLRQKGYIVSSMEMEIILEENSEEYGRIKSMNISLSRKKSEEDKNDTNEISVDKIEIGKAETKSEIEEITQEEEYEIKGFLSQEYGIEYEQIVIK